MSASIVNVPTPQIFVALATKRKAVADKAAVREGHLRRAALAQQEGNWPLADQLRRLAKKA